MGYVCQEEGFTAVVAVQVEWVDDDYEVLSNSGQTAQVSVKGAVHVTVDTEDLEMWMDQELLSHVDPSPSP